MTFDVIEPAVIDAPQSTILDPSVTQVGPSVRTVKTQ